MNKLDKTYNILKNRLPKNYIIPVKIYKTTVGMLRAEAKCNFKGNYKRTINYYNEYFKNSKTNTYVNTKYYKKFNRKILTAFDIACLAGNPIWLSLQAIKRMTIPNIVFLLLHEIGHFIMNTHDEHKCDNFAIRWTRKLKKEGLIK